MGEPTYKTLALDSDGDLAIPVRLSTGLEAARQLLVNRFNAVLRDWFLDLRRGIPYHEAVFIKNPNLSVIRGIFRQVLETTRGVSNVTRFDLTVDTKTRAVSIGPFEAIITDGQIFRAQPGELIVRFP